MIKVLIKVTLIVIPMESVNYKKCLLEKQWISVQAICVQITALSQIMTDGAKKNVNMISAYYWGLVHLQNLVTHPTFSLEYF